MDTCVHKDTFTSVRDVHIFFIVPCTEFVRKVCVTFPVKYFLFYNSQRIKNIFNKHFENCEHLTEKFPEQTMKKLTVMIFFPIICCKIKPVHFQ